VVTAEKKCATCGDSDIHELEDLDPERPPLGTTGPVPTEAFDAQLSITFKVKSHYRDIFVRSNKLEEL
jgi:hypothetical protein